MTKPLQRFWTMIDALPGAETDRRDWRIRLGIEFAWARTFLRVTGRRATAIDCPAPGGDGCPRGVIRTGDGTLRAVCRSAVGRCDPVELVADDIDILKLDIRLLRRALIVALNLREELPHLPAGSAITLGKYAVAAGVSAPVVLAVAGPMQPVLVDELRGAGLGRERGVVLAPTEASMPALTRRWLSEQGHLLLNLSEVMAMDDDGGLLPVQPPELLLRDIRDGLLDRLTAAKPGPRIAVPPGTTWSQLSLRLTSAETVICNVAGTPRQMDPGGFGMRSGTNAKPITAWTFFISLLAGGGSVKLAGGSSPSLRQQKRALSRHLQATFGLADDPIRWVRAEQAYVTAFVAADDRPKAERERWMREVMGRARR